MKKCSRGWRRISVVLGVCALTLGPKLASAMVFIQVPDASQIFYQTDAAGWARLLA